MIIPHEFLERHQNNPEAVIVEVKRMADEGKFLDNTIDRDLRERNLNSVTGHAALTLHVEGLGPRS